MAKTSGLLVLRTAAEQQAVQKHLTDNTAEWQKFQLPQSTNYKNVHKEGE